MSQYLGDISAYALAVSQGYTGTEEEYAELMASYATVGQTAVTAAQTATTKASEAATAATTATNKASEATTAATTATTKAGEASTSANTATSAKDTAVSASQTATTKATEATTAAATATSAATTATTAKDDAVSAKTAAQTAQTGAETAAASVSASAAQIATNAADISQLKSEITDKSDTADMLKAFPTDTALGSVASFADGANVLVKSLIVNIDPVQSGSGDPSPDNVRPISGWSEVNVQRTGVNVWDEEWEVGNISADNGENVTATDRIRSKNYISVVPGASYYFKASNTIGLRLYDGDKHYVTSTVQTNLAYTIPANIRYVRFIVLNTTTYNHDISINYPATDTDYHEGHVQSINIDLGQTVYGGTLDVLSGELVIDRAMRTLTGADDWILDSDRTSLDGVTCLRAYQEMSALKKPVGNEGNRTYIGAIIASNLPTVKNGYANQLNMDGIDIAITGYAGGEGNYLYIIVNKSTMSIRTVADLKAWLAENNVQFCYELATPITVQLTPHEVTALLGSNNIWSDAGEVTAEYRADPTLYIQRKIAEALS